MREGSRFSLAVRNSQNCGRVFECVYPRADELTATLRLIRACSFKFGDERLRITSYTQRRRVAYVLSSRGRFRKTIELSG